MNFMNLSQRTAAFIELGNRIQQLDEETKEELFWRSQNGNNWFTEDSVSSAFKGLVSMLQEEKLRSWIGNYEIKEELEPKSVGILMAGNIPMVGFHDLMTVLISGNKACIKLSSSDSILMNWVFDQLIDIEPEFKSFISVEEMLKEKDAYIATGSDNSARYFNYYFGKYPSVIRQNRTSIAILSGEESTEDLKNLGEDIFKYFGLGCRNVSKVFVKSKDQIKELLDALEGYSSIADHHKYHNNYEYNKSIFLVNNEAHLDNGFLLVKESTELVSPISVLYFETYDSKNDLLKKLDLIKDKIQCIVADSTYWGGGVSFGNAQQPEPWDYADNVDTMEFLIGLN